MTTKPVPDSREYWQKVAQGLGIRCFDLNRALAQSASELETAREALRQIAEIQYNRLDAEQGDLSQHAELALAALSSPPEEKK